MRQQAGSTSRRRLTRPRTMSLAFAVLALVAAGLQAAPAGGQTGAPGGILSAADATLAWGGSFVDSTAPSSPDLYASAEACETLPCREFALEVDLPEGVWDDGAGPGGGVQVAVNWAPQEENDLDLYVYGPSGELVARSDGFFASTGESVRLRDTGNGRYRVVVVPRLVRGEMAYRGEGPFELRYRMEGLATDQQLRQRIYASDGSFTEAQVDTYEFHPTHAHFHYKSFGQAFLYRVHPDGSLEKVRESRKNGFCLVDVENTLFGADADGRPYRGEAPRHYYFPSCNAPTERDASGLAMVNGISAGWADVYNWFLADQYIEISDIPDGLYVLETVANPARTVHETTMDDNTARVVIRLDHDSVELVGGDVTPRATGLGPAEPVDEMQVDRVHGWHRFDNQPARAPPGNT